MYSCVPLTTTIFSKLLEKLKSVTFPQRSVMNLHVKYAKNLHFGILTQAKLWEKNILFSFFAFRNSLVTENLVHTFPFGRCVLLWSEYKSTVQFLRLTARKMTFDSKSLRLRKMTFHYDNTANELIGLKVIWLNF